MIARVAAAASVSVLGLGCLVTNPAFDSDAESTGTATVATGSTSTPSTGPGTNPSTSTSSSSTSNGSTGTSSSTGTTTPLTGTTASPGTDTMFATMTMTGSSSGTSDATKGTETETGTGTGSTGTTGADQQFLNLFAIAAGCIVLNGNVIVAQADECEMGASQGNMNMGLGEMMVGQAAEEFENFRVVVLLEIPWDPILNGATIDFVELGLTTTGHPDKSGGPESGDVWRSQAFDLGLLAMNLPPVIGDMPVGQSVGPVPDFEEILIELDPSVISPGESTYLQVIPLTLDSVYYWNTKAPNPGHVPHLHILYTP